MAEPLNFTTDSNGYAITIDDTSPTISYTPFADTFSTPNIAAGWNPYFSQSGFVSDATAGETGSGTSLHVTAADNASFSIRWNGTDISLLGALLLSGNTSFASYSLSLDGTPTTNYASTSSSPPNVTSDILAAFGNLTYGAHEVILTMHNPGSIFDGSVMLQFDRAVVIGGAPPNISTPSNTTSTSATPTFTTEAFPDDLVSFRGQWSFTPNLIPNQTVTFHTSNHVGDIAHLSFNGTAITISGLTTPLSGSYNVSFDDESPLTFSARSSFQGSAPTILYYRTGLDPNRTHQVDIVNLGATSPSGGIGNLLALDGINVTTIQVSVPSPSSVPVGSMSTSSGLPAGAIAGIAIGTSAACILFLALVFCFVRRRRTAQRKREFLINPRLSRLRRFSFLSRTSRSVHGGDAERGIEEVRIEHTPNEGVLDISESKEDSEDDHDIQPSTFLISGEDRHRNGGHAAQNSDGSFSVELPDVPQRSVLNIRTSVADRAMPPPLPTASPVTPATPRSPRPRGPRIMPSIVVPPRHSIRGILLPDSREPGPSSRVSPQDDSRIMTRLGDQTDSMRIDFEQTSPFRVNFEDESQEQSLQRRESRFTTISGFSLPQSLRNALASAKRFSESSTFQDANAPQNNNPESHFSFLDFESSTSRSTSVKSGGPSARQSRSTSSKSRHSGQELTVPPVVPPLPTGDTQKSFGLSLAIGSPPSDRPSLSPNFSLQPVSLSSPSTQNDPIPALPEDIVISPVDQNPSEPHRSLSPGLKSELPDFLPSPTDSIPASVSDIHFKHSSYSSSQPDSRRASANPSRFSGAKPPHPPMPDVPLPMQQIEHRPFIVQKLLGMPTGPGPTSPFNSPMSPAFAVSAIEGSSARGSTSASGSGSRTISPAPPPPPASLAPPTPSSSTLAPPSKPRFQPSRKKR